MSKKKTNAKSTRLQKYKVILSNFQKRFPKWKFFALGIIAVIAIAIGLGVGLQPSSNTSTTAQTGDTVKVSYIGTYDNSSVFDSSNSSAPLQFTIGNSSMIPGFEKAIIGMSVNETKKIRVKPEEGYGPAELKEDIDSFPTGVAVGQYYNHTMDNGVYIEARVTAVNGSIVTLQNVNPMAGQNLNFEITLVELIKATTTPGGNTSG